MLIDGLIAVGPPAAGRNRAEAAGGPTDRAGARGDEGARAAGRPAADPGVFAGAKLTATRRPLATARPSRQAESSAGRCDELGPDGSGGLRQWRQRVGQAAGVPIVSDPLEQRRLEELARQRPTSPEALLEIHGIGPAKLPASASRCCRSSSRRSSRRSPAGRPGAELHRRLRPARRCDRPSDSTATADPTCDQRGPRCRGADVVARRPASLVLLDVATALRRVLARRMRGDPRTAARDALGPCPAGRR